MFPSLRLVDHPDVAHILREREMFTELLKDQLAKAQNRMKVYADANCSERSFQVGEQVLLKLQPYAQSSLVNHPFPKLAYKYFGPYTILEKLGSVAYKLQLPDSSSVHLVFHVSQLKSFTPDYTPVQPSLPDIPTLDILEVIPEKIIDIRLVKKGNIVVTQVLIQLSGLSDSLATWEYYNVLQSHFPLAPTWGQAGSLEGGGVLSPPSLKLTTTGKAGTFECIQPCGPRMLDHGLGSCRESFLRERLARESDSL
jgi:hypothetical protein